MWGLVFISPWIVGFLLFYLAPMLASLGFSLFDFNPMLPDQREFIGLDNWERALFLDKHVWPSFGKTFLFGAISMPISLISALVLAMLLNVRHLHGRTIFRTLFFMPALFPLVASTLIWNGVFNEYTGWVNLFIDKLTPIQALGPQGLRWTQDVRLVYFAYTAMGLWGIGNAVVVFLAGLQGVPTELYEAATVDGANRWQRLFNITLPMITPVIFYQVLLGLIGLLQYFLAPFVLNRGDGSPEGMTRFIMVWFYKQSFTFFNMGYGATLAWLIFAVAMVLTLILFGTARCWVYYEAGERSE